ncbi:MAG: hypothetical protein JW934_08635 [Anaerolineae bacterium]|nr:hypothetical protein [Anaerolineae bacterium]
MGESTNEQIANRKSQNRQTANSKSRAAQGAVCYLLFASLLLGALSYWLPWVDHPTAALKLSGQDMGEFIKFIPAFRNGEVKFGRQLFYLPPLVCTLSLTLIGINRHLPYPRWLRIAALGIALLLLPGLLPPVWGTPKDWFTAEFRWQGVALILGALFVLAHGAFRRLPLRRLTVSLILLALIGLLPAQWALWRIKPYVWAVYGTPTIRLGWGLWLHWIAWIGAATTAIWASKGEAFSD